MSVVQEPADGAGALDAETGEPVALPDTVETGGAVVAVVEALLTVLKVVGIVAVEVKTAVVVRVRGEVATDVEEFVK